jgi:hypothetical protein
MSAANEIDREWRRDRRKLRTGHQQFDLALFALASGASKAVMELGRASVSMPPASNETRTLRRDS